MCSARLLLLLAPVAVLCVAASPPRATPVSLAELKGLTPREVRDRLGPPHRVARQVFFQGYYEQWVYERPTGYRVRLEVLLGGGPKIVSVQPLGDSTP